jgi:ABC-type uncharacterized transport system substrate-binding protein
MVPTGMIRSPLAFAIALLAVIFTGDTVFAHPHVWVTSRSKVVYRPDGSAIGVAHAWTFDDMYSAFATQGLEQKVKGEFRREELQPLAKVNVESLKEYDFFTYAKADGKDQAFTDPVEYYLEYNHKEGVLTLFFLLPFKTPVNAKKLNIEVYDPTYFVDFELDKKDPAELSGAPAGCKLSTALPQGMTKELAQQLALIPADGQIPSNISGAAFANKIDVTCP